MTITEIFDREARALCERQNIAFHDWQKSTRDADVIFVRGVQSNGERVEIWALEFRAIIPTITPSDIASFEKWVEVKKAELVMCATVGFEQPDCIIEETHAYNRWGQAAPDWYKSNAEYEG